MNNISKFRIIFTAIFCCLIIVTAISFVRYFSYQKVEAKIISVVSTQNGKAKKAQLIYEIDGEEHTSLIELTKYTGKHDGDTINIRVSPKSPEKIMTSSTLVWLVILDVIFGFSVIMLFKRVGGEN